MKYIIFAKKNIEMDINKIGNRFSSDIFSSKNELKDILGIFIYISNINILENEIASMKAIAVYEDPIIISKQKLVDIIKKKISITDDRLLKIIEYFTINGYLKWAFNEYPLINVEDNLIWASSSFIMNDFQFSIVNGHYEKDILIYNREKTVSRALVDNIERYCSRFENIIITKEVKYVDHKNLYNNKKLMSDVDVAIYDIISNSVLIIECKWTEKLYLKGDRYDKICEFIDETYRNQLNKHEHYLKTDEKNIDFIFKNNKRIKERPYYPSIEYILLDKRVQLHYGDKHLLSEFNFYEIIDSNVVNNILRLDKVISDIKSLNTEVEYSIGKTISQISYDGRVINNSLFKFM